MSVELKMGINSIWVTAHVTPTVVSRSKTKVTIKYTIVLDSLGDRWWGFGVRFHLYEDGSIINTLTAQGTSADPNHLRWGTTTYTMQVTRDVGYDKGTKTLQMQIDCNANGGFLNGIWYHPKGDIVDIPCSYDATYKGIMRINSNGWKPCYVYIYNNGWQRCVPYIYTGGSWKECGY